MFLKLFRHLFVLITLALAACADKPQEPLRVGAVLWPGYEPLYLAGKLGYYDKQPIKIVDYLSNTDAMLAFRNNNLQAGAFTLDETLQIIADGIDVNIVLIMDVSNGGDVILANQDIQSISDLRDQPVAVESTAVGAYVLTRALQLHDMETSDVHIVSVNALEQASSFDKGTVVAAVSFDPYRTQLMKAGKKQIFDSTMIPDEIFDVLIVRKDYAARHPQTVHQLVKAWFRALEYQQKQPIKSAGYSLSRFDTTTADYLDGLKLLKFSSRQTNRILLNDTTSPLLRQQDKIVDILQDLNLITNRPSLKGHLNDDYIPQ
jgi:NitT/TauT family transport system substrate-binding protein